MDNNLVFSRERMAFNWLRLKYANSWFTAMHMHGSLTWKAITTLTGSKSSTDFNEI